MPHVFTDGACESFTHPEDGCPTRPAARAVEYSHMPFSSVEPFTRFLCSGTPPTEEVTDVRSALRFDVSRQRTSMRRHSRGRRRGHGDVLHRLRHVRRQRRHTQDPGRVSPSSAGRLGEYSCDATLRRDVQNGDCSDSPFMKFTDEVNAGSRQQFDEGDLRVRGRRRLLRGLRRRGALVSVNRLGVAQLRRRLHIPPSSVEDRADLLRPRSPRR